MKSMADIKHSMRAVQDTSKITKAMYLIFDCEGAQSA